MKDVAAIAKVDPSVVSRVVNGAAGRTSEETRRRVLAAVIECNYQPNVVARGLRTSRSYTLGLVLPDLSNPVYTAIVKGAQAAADQSGYNLVLGSDVEQHNAEQAFARMLRGGRVDGLLFSSGSMHDQDLLALALDHAPIVVVNRLVKGVGSSVVVDDEGAAHLAMSHILDLGHREVVAVTGPKVIDTSLRRSKGFLRAAKEAGLRKPRVFYCPAWGAESGYAAIREIFSTGQQPTAVVAMSLTVAIGILKGCRDEGITVPTDVSVIALHDNALAEYVTPTLTTVSLPLEELGSQAVRQLLRKLDGEAVGALTVDAPPLLIQRASTSRAPR